MLAVLSAGLMVGCTVGPDFHQPTLSGHARYQKGGVADHTASAPGDNGAAQALVPADNIRGSWYGLFHSQALDGLIADALKHSPTIRAGQARLAAAREAVNIANGGRLPQLDAGIGVSRNRLSGVEFGINDPSFQNTYMLYKGQLSLGYDLDLFGKHRRAIEGQKALYRARQYRLLNTSLTLVDNVVASTLNQAGLRASVHALKHIIKVQKDALRIVANKKKYGAATAADTARARALVAATRARLPELQKQLQLARDRLALLTGHTPGDFDDPDITLDELQLPTKLPLALPSQLVARRPDILAATNRLHWASARIGVAKANLLPDISISAAYTRAALSTGGLTEPASILYNFGASIFMPLFHGGILRARKRAVQDRYKAILADYRQTVLTAFRQVADSLHALQQDAKALAARRAALKAAKDSLDVVNLQVGAGSATYLSLFEAQTQYQKALLKATGARVQRFRDSARLIRSLGGGWWTQPDSPLATAAQLVLSEQDHNK